MNVFQLLCCVSVLRQTVVHVLYLFGILNFLILNPHQFMLCPQHTLSRCGRVGPQIFMRKPNTHPCLPTRFPLVCMTFFSSVRLTTLFFASSWKAIPTQTNLIDLSPEHGEKKMRCPSEFKGHQLFGATSKFFTHVCFLSCATFR